MVRSIIEKYNVQSLKKNQFIYGIYPYSWSLPLTLDVKRDLRIASQIIISSAIVITPPADMIIMVIKDKLFLSGRFVLDGGWYSDKDSIPFNFNFVDL